MRITSATFVGGIRGTDPIAYDATPQVAFVGRSNVGKSSLINSLTGNKNLVKVSSKPGKTTEINFFLINKKDYLVDLPGYGYAEAGAKQKAKLRALILWYLAESEIVPRLVVLVIDVKVGVTAFDREMIAVLRAENHPFIVVANKADKLGKNALAKQLALIKTAAGGVEVIPCSAITAGSSHAVLQRIFA